MKTIALNDHIFTKKFNEPLVHQVIVAQMAGGRSGTKAQKTRAEVRGGGRKPWRQKGTGRARAGTIRSPLWRKGGKIFAAEPRDFSQKVNRKMYRGALHSIVSELFRQDRLVLVDDLTLTAPKTSEFLASLKSVGLEGKSRIMIVLPEWDENVYLASRNLFYVEVYLAGNVDPVSLVQADKVIVTERALKKLEECVA